MKYCAVLLVPITVDFHDTSGDPKKVVEMARKIAAGLKGVPSPVDPEHLHEPKVLLIAEVKEDAQPVNADDLIAPGTPA